MTAPDNQTLAQVSPKSTNIFAVEHRVTPRDRHSRNGHESGVLWLTGLSGAGKSTIALELEARLFERGYQVYVLDGDNVRHGLASDLGFSPADRAENIRRIGEASKLFADAGLIVITAFISPYREDRQIARAINEGRFHEVHVQADLAVCEARDPKGLYKKARAGEIPQFTGISAPYEAPDAPEVVVDTSRETVEQSAQRLIAYIEANFLSPALRDASVA